MAANTKDKWLKQEDVHAACESIKARGERVSTNSVYDELGERGSYKTIQKFIVIWEAENSDQLEEIKNLPISAEIPESIEGVGKKLLKTYWNEAKAKADAELDIQREALKQAEANANNKVDEITFFSGKQTETITVLREQLAEQQTQLTNEKNKTDKLNELISQEHDKLNAIEKERDLSIQEVKNTTDQLNKSGNDYHELKTSSGSEIMALRGDIEKLNESHEKELKTAAKENKELEKQVQTLEVKLDISIKSADKLQAEIKSLRDAEKEANKRADMLEGKLDALSNTNSN